MTRTTWQYFFMAAKSFSNCFLPSSSCHFLQYFVKAFFLDLYLRAGRREHRLAQVLHNPTGPAEEHSAQLRATTPCIGRGLVSRRGFRLMAQFLRSTFHWPEEPGAHQGTWHLSGAATRATVMLDSLSETTGTNICFSCQQSSLNISNVSPVLIEATLALLTDVLSKDGLEGTKATGGVNVAHDTNHHHGGCLHNGHGLHYFLLVHL